MNSYRNGFAAVSHALMLAGPVETRLPWRFATLLSLRNQSRQRRRQRLVRLTFDTTPNCTDTTPFPSTSTKWTYRTIYRVGDSRVGQWSKPVNVTAGK